MSRKYSGAKKAARRAAQKKSGGFKNLRNQKAPDREPSSETGTIRDCSLRYMVATARVDLSPMPKQSGYIEL